MTLDHSREAEEPLTLPAHPPAPNRRRKNAKIRMATDHSNGANAFERQNVPLVLQQNNALLRHVLCDFVAVLDVGNLHLHGLIEEADREDGAQNAVDMVVQFILRHFAALHAVDPRRGAGRQGGSGRSRVCEKWRHRDRRLRRGFTTMYCKPRTNGILDDLFGIERVGQPAAKTLAVSLETGVLAGCLVDAGIRLKDGVAHGKAADGTPVLIVRAAGKGRAILLNFSKPEANQPEEWIKSAVAGIDPQVRELRRKLFAEAGIVPTIAVRDETGQPIPGLEVVRWQNGPNELLALFAPAGEKRRASVELTAAGPRFVYDLRNRQPLGPAPPNSRRPFCPGARASLRCAPCWSRRCGCDGSDRASPAARWRNSRCRCRRSKGSGRFRSAPTRAGRIWTG